MKRRDLLKAGASALLLGSACAAPGRQVVRAPPRDDERARRWTRVMTASPGDLDLEVHESRVDGRIPGALRGARYLLNGPGRLGYGRSLAHPFDGHGYVRAFQFTRDGGVSLRARFVQTPAFVVEEHAQRLVVPGIGTLPDPGPSLQGAPTLRNVANTTVLPFGDRLLCGWEGGHPFAVDRESLHTVGEESFDGALGEGATLAHFRVDPVTRRLVTLSLSMGLSTRLVFREFDDEGRLCTERATTVDGMSFVHDFVVTRRWYILARNPLSLDPAAFLRAKLHRGTLLDAITSDPAQVGGLLMIPREGAGEVQHRFVSVGGPLYAVHFANAFDDDNGVVVDVCAFPDVTFGTEFGYRGSTSPLLDPGLSDERQPQRLMRVRVHSSGQADLQQIARHALDFPRVDANREGLVASTLFAASRTEEAHCDPFDALAAVDLIDLEREEELWVPGAERYVGEPVFFPAEGAASHQDRRGYVVALVYDGARSSSTLVVLDAQKLGAGPIASAPLPLLPYGFHGYAETAPS
ncbi:MAG: carotenoid oxygenase family protein [Myxococcota bacterium]